MVWLITLFHINTILYIYIAIWIVRIHRREKISIVYIFFVSKPTFSPNHK